MAQQIPLPLTISCSSKSRLVLTFLVLPFWYLLTRVVPDIFQKSSKTVVCVCVCVHHLTHPLVREAHQHQRSEECTPTINRNYDTQVSTAMGGARGADARQPDTETAPVWPADTWRLTGKWTKTELQGHHQAQHKSLRHSGLPQILGSKWQWSNLNTALSYTAEQC